MRCHASLALEMYLRPCRSLREIEPDWMYCGSRSSAERECEGRERGCARQSSTEDGAETRDPGRAGAAPMRLRAPFPGNARHAFRGRSGRSIAFRTGICINSSEPQVEKFGLRSTGRLSTLSSRRSGPRRSGAPESRSRPGARDGQGGEILRCGAECGSGKRTGTGEQGAEWAVLVRARAARSPAGRRGVKLRGSMRPSAPNQRICRAGRCAGWGWPALGAPGAPAAAVR